MERHLPFFEIADKAVRVPFEHFPALFKVGAPLLFLMAIGSIAEFTVIKDDSESEKIFAAIFLIPAVIALLIAIIGCHRIILLGDQEVLNKGFFQWTGNEVKYAGWVVGITILVGMLNILLNLLVMLPLFALFETEHLPILQTVIILIVSFPAYYVFSRLSLLLPSAALGKHGKTLRWSWKLTINNGIKLVFLLFYLPLLLNMAINVIPLDDSIVSKIFSNIVFLILGVIEIAMLSYTYSYLVNSKDEYNASGSMNA